MAFHAARGTAGYQVRIERWHEKGRDVELDSREGLAAGDLFAAALVMPGRYRVLLGRKTVTEIKVRDPNPEKPHRTDQPVLVRSGQPRALRACRAAGREGQGGLIARALPGKERLSAAYAGRPGIAGAWMRATRAAARVRAAIRSSASRCVTGVLLQCTTGALRRARSALALSQVRSYSRPLARGSRASSFQLHTRRKRDMATAKMRKAAVTELRLAIAPDTPFDEIVSILKQTLTVPELPGLKGCRPCLSGLDRFIIEDIVQRGMR